MRRSGLGINAGSAVFWVAAWLGAATVWSVIAVVRGVMKPSRPLGLVWLVIAISLIASGLFVADEAWPEGTAPTVEVIDGNTLRIDGKIVRLWGVDAPELRQSCQAHGTEYACGQKAREYMDAMVRGKRVVCRAMSGASYGRDVSWCVVGPDNRDLAYQLVLGGWALDYRQYSQGHYAAPERRAEVLKRGMWAGTFVAPWDWRRQ